VQVLYNSARLVAAAATGELGQWIARGADGPVGRGTIADREMMVGSAIAGSQLI